MVIKSEKKKIKNLVKDSDVTKDKTGNAKKSKVCFTDRVTNQRSDRPTNVGSNTSSAQMQKSREHLLDGRKGGH